MIRKIERADGARFEVFGMRPPCSSPCKHKECSSGRTRKTYVGTYDSEADAIEARSRFSAQQRTASGRVVALKIYAVHANGAESLLLHDTMGDDHRTYEVDINSEPVGVWLQRLDVSTAPSGMTDEEFKRWYYDDATPATPNGAPF